MSDDRANVKELQHFFIKMIVFKIYSEKDFFWNDVTSFVKQFLSRYILGRSNNIPKILRLNITAIF